MPWVKLDDSFPDHPKVVQAGPLARDLYVAALCYCSRYLTDGYVPAAVVPRLAQFDGITVTGLDPATPLHQYATERLVAVGLWDAADDGSGYWIHDYLEYNPSKESVLRERDVARRRWALNNNPKLAKAVRERDGDLCRYCGKHVNWSDRKSPNGGTYDHIIPIDRGGGESEENMVVACRACKTRKGARTPEQAGMPLLPPGTSQESIPGLTGTSQKSARNQTEISQESSTESRQPVPVPVPDPIPNKEPSGGYKPPWEERPTDVMGWRDAMARAKGSREQTAVLVDMARAHQVGDLEHDAGGRAAGLLRQTGDPMLAVQCLWDSLKARDRDGDPFRYALGIASQKRRPRQPVGASITNPDRFKEDA